MLTETEFDTTYQELLDQHGAGQCPVDCAFCEEDRPPREIDPDEGEPLVVELGLNRHHDGRSSRATTYDNSGYRFTFGKHKGEVIAQVPRKYLDWVLSITITGKPKDEWIRQAKAAIRRYLQTPAETPYERHADREATRKEKRRLKNAQKAIRKNKTKQDAMARRNAGSFSRARPVE